MSSRYDNDRRRSINTFLKNLQDLSNLCYLTYCYINQGYNSLLLAITFLYIIKSPAAGYSKTRVCGFNLKVISTTFNKSVSVLSYPGGGKGEVLLKMGVSSLSVTQPFFFSSRNPQTAVWETRECSKIKFAKIPLFCLYKLLELSGRADTPPSMRNSKLEIRFADFSGRPQWLTALMPSFWHSYFKKLSNILG